jgi:hypothetical protein
MRRVRASGIYANQVRKHLATASHAVATWERNVPRRHASGISQDIDLSFSPMSPRSSWLARFRPASGCDRAGLAGCQ